jgi:hypothetical protein
MHGGAAAGVAGLLFLLIAVVVGLAALAFWIWMLIHAIQNKGLTDTERIIWVLVVVLLHLLGALIYFFVGRPKATG